MAGKIARSWKLMGASWDILKSNKQLALFPILSGTSLALVSISFFIPLFFEQNENNASSGHPYWLILFYFCNYMVITFFNTGLVACTIRIMRGESISFTDGINEAWQHKYQILGWAAIASTVGMILRLIENKSDIIGRIIAAILGTAFSLASFLVIPIMLVENKNPVDAMKQSSKMLRKTWGEQIVGNFGFALLFLLLWLPCFALVTIGVITLAIVPPVGALLLLAAFIYGIALVLMPPVLHSIFQTALYLYGSTGKIAPGFDKNVIEQAFLPKK
jgi:hypothetical protein